MILINLLPFRGVRQIESVRRQFFIFIALLFLASALLLWCYIYLNGKLEYLTAKSTTDRLILNEINGFNRKINVINKKLEAVRKLESKRKWPVSLLNAMNRALVPGKMRLIEISAKEENIGIKGVALDNKTVAIFLERLNGVKLFDNVLLKTLKQQQIRDEVNPLKRFEIDCTRINFSKNQKK